MKGKASAWLALKLIFGITLIAALTLWTYHGTTENSFVWDSVQYVINHVFYLSNLAADNIIWMFLSLEVVNWHPLTWLSWAVDSQIYGGLVASGFHLSNNIYHAINSVLVFALTLVVFGLNTAGLKGYPIRTDNNALLAALVAAALFAVHPQHVESVAWIAERKDLLCLMFLLLSMLAYAGYASCREGLRSVGTI